MKTEMWELPESKKKPEAGGWGAAWCGYWESGGKTGRAQSRREH